MKTNFHSSTRRFPLMNFTLFGVAYVLFVLLYILNAGGENVCRIMSGFGGIQSCVYHFPNYSNTTVAVLVFVLFVLAIFLTFIILVSNSFTKKHFVRFLKFYIPISVVALALSTQPIPMGSVALGSTSIEVIVPVFMLCVFWFVFSTLYITFAKRQRLWIAIPGVCIASIVATVGHFYLLSVAEDVAKHHKAFFVEHCEVTAVTTDNKMRCF